jgi:hypothetical protein
MRKDGIGRKGRRAVGKGLTLLIEVEVGEVAAAVSAVVEPPLLGIEVHDASTGLHPGTPGVALLRKAARIVKLVVPQPLRRRRSLGLGHA